MQSVSKFLAGALFPSVLVISSVGGDLPPDVTHSLYTVAKVSLFVDSNGVESYS